MDILGFFRNLGRQDRAALLEADFRLAEGKAAYRAARASLATAMAARRQEELRAEALRARRADLEGRAVAAFRGGREDLAREAAEKIAQLEDTLAAIATSLQQQDIAITRLRRQVEDQHRLIGEIERNRRLGEVQAVIAETRVSTGRAATGLAAARDALTALRHRQDAEDILHDALEDPGANLIEAMGHAGFGAAPHASTEAVFARLRSQATALLPPTTTA